MWNGHAPSTTLDSSVVNILEISPRAQVSCTYTVMDTEPAGVIKNGVFVVNATVDVSPSTICSTVQIALFDSVYGSFQNVSVLGNISVVNALPN